MADSATYTPETLQRRYAMAQALLAPNKEPIRHWAQGLNELAQGALGGYQLGNTERLEAKQRGDANAQVMAALGLGGQTPAAPSALPMQPAPAGGAPAAVPDRIVGAESGGVPTATNPNSTAAGPGQFIDSTWLETLKKNRPDLAAGKDDAALLAMRTDPAQAGLSRDMTDAYAKQNSGTLAAAGLPVTPGTTYLAHFAGPTGATKILSADPATPVSGLLSPAAIQANPQIANMSAGDLRAWADKKMGGGAPGASPAVGAIASALNGGPSGAPTAGAGAPPSPAVADVAKTLSSPAGAPGAAPAAPLAGPAGVGANPNAKAIAAVLTSPWIDPSVKQAVIAQSSPSFGFQTLPDGTIIRTNPKTGQVEPIYQAPTKPDFGVIGKDSNGNDIHGFIDKNKQTTTPAAGAPALGASSNSSLTGEPFLQTLDAGRANEVKAIADGRMAPPGGMSLKSPQIQGLMRDVAQYEPGFDMTSWKARNDTRADLAKGKMGQNVSSFNTAIGHLETLDKAADKLGNTWSPTYNSIKNMASSALGNPEVNSFNVAKTAVADELTRAFRGSGGNVHDLTQWETAINNAGSPAQLKAAIRQAVDLLHSRISAVGDQYNRGMGKTTDPLELLTPKAKAGIQRLMGDAPQEAPTASKSAPGANTTKSGVTWSVE